MKYLQVSLIAISTLLIGCQHQDEAQPTFSHLSVSVTNDSFGTQLDSVMLYLKSGTGETKQSLVLDASGMAFEAQIHALDTGHYDLSGMEKLLYLLS